MENIKLGFNLLGKYVVCLIMCFFITFSFIAIFTMIAPPPMAGYEAAVLENEEADTPMDSYVHYYSDGEDIKKAEYEKEGYIVNTREFAGKLSGTPYTVCHIIVQIINLILFIFIISHGLNKKGRIDASNISRGHGEEDLLCGLKVGIVPAAFSLVTWIFLILGKLGIVVGGTAIYAYGNYHLFGYQQLIFSGAASPAEIGWLGVALALLPVVLTLAVCAVSYLLGYKGINVYEKTVYKSK